MAAVVRRGETILLGRRPSHKRHGGLWEFPGGKVHAGEERLDAVRRELGEELGVRVVGIGDELFAAADPDTPFVIHFVETEIEGEPRAIEHAALRWAGPAEAAGLELAPADRRFVEAWLERG